MGYMMKLRTALLPAFLWEAGRYVLLVNLLQLFLNPLGTPEYGFFFFWFGSYAFFVMLGLGAAFFHGEKYGVIVSVVGAGKLLQALAGLLFILYELGVIPVLMGFLSGGIEGLVPASLLGRAVPAGGLVVLLDLISGIFLLLYRSRESRRGTVRTGRAGGTGARGTGDRTPLQDSVPVDITDVEEE